MTQPPRNPGIAEIDTLPAAEKHRDWAAFVIAALLLAAAAVIAWDATTLELSTPYGLGPKAMPFAVAAGLAVLALANLVAALRGELPYRETMKFAPVALILGGFAALVAIIGFGGGFIIATAVLFAATATAFGRRAVLIDLALGFVIATAIYLLFDKLLTLSLPAGPLERLL